MASLPPTSESPLESPSKTHLIHRMWQALSHRWANPFQDNVCSRSTGKQWGTSTTAVALIATLGFLLPISTSEHPTPDHGFDLSEPQLPMMQAAYVPVVKTPQDMIGDFYFTLGNNMAIRGQLLEAEKLLSKAVEILPDNISAHYQYAYVLAALGKNEAATQAYLNLLKVNPKLVIAYYKLSILYEKLGQVPDSIDILHKGLEYAPDNPVLHYNLGVLYANTKEFKESAHHSKMSIQGNPDFAESYNNYGYALSHLGDYEESLKMINKSLELKPNSAATLDSKGFALYGLKRYEEAIEAYKAALELDPTIGEIYLHYGQVLEKTKDYGKALEAYKTFLNLEPKSSQREEIETRIEALEKRVDTSQ